MKKAEWERRIELDLFGVQMLGAALLIRTEKLLSDAEKVLEKKKNPAPDDPPLRHPFDIEHYDQSVARLKRHCRSLRFMLDAIGFRDAGRKRAAQLRIWDFRFRWDHLRDHPILVGYLSDNQPYFAVEWDRTTPVADRPDDSVISVLHDIFVAEQERLLGFDPDDVPTLRDPEDFLFYLTVWELCEPEQGRGARGGRRWADGLYNAASYASSLRTRARESGKPISNEEAIRQSLYKFEIIASTEFEDHPRKDEVIVSDALGEGGRYAGALKAVRKQLALFDKQEQEL